MIGPKINKPKWIQNATIQIEQIKGHSIDNHQTD